MYININRVTTALIDKYVLYFGQNHPPILLSSLIRLLLFQKCYHLYFLFSPIHLLVFLKTSHIQYFLN